MHLTHAHALVIGVSGYAFVRPLPRTSDAEDVAALLRDPEQGAYPPKQVRTLVEAEATKANVLEALGELAKRATEESTVLVYFSGHGGRATERSGGECYLLPVEAKTTSDEVLAETALSATELGARLRAIRAARLTVVLDCCRASGAADVKDFGPGEVDGTLPEGVLGALARGRGRVVLAASRADGYAFVQPGERNGVFTKHLLAALRGGAGGAGGVVRVCDVFDYVQRKVAAEAPGQRPVFKAEIEDNYPLALYRGGDAPPLELPPAPDAFRFDAFVSYRRSSPDQAWVEKQLVPRLEALGLRLCFERRDFKLGAPRIREMERAVTESRYTLAVLSRSYLAGGFQDFEALLSQHQAIETGAPRFIPLLREECVPNLGIRTTEWLDVRDDEELEANLARLALRLREPPHATPGG
ncbi:MAG TPA: TIR domain-containing protein [Polyangiaceae bacterium]|nr:TIR domain-containing protein [Polyangiaceae bacterium]